MSASSPSSWHGTLGAIVEQGGTRFRVWSDRATALDVVLGDGTAHPMNRDGDEWSAFVAGVGAGARYRYRIDGGATRTGTQPVVLWQSWQALPVVAPPDV